MPIFHGFDKSIRKILEINYDRVFFFSELPYSSNTKFHFLRRFSKSLAEKELVRFNYKVLNFVIRNKIERIFIIRGYGLNESFLKGITSQSWNIEIFHYQWDSFINNPNALLISQYTKHNFTFDLVDTSYNSRFKHLPLFYSWEGIIKNENTIQDIDILFIGGYHSGRHLFVNKIEKLCLKLGLNFFSYIYLSPYVYIGDKLSENKIEKRNIHFAKISRQLYHNYLNRSKIILDIHSPSQSGATMRTIEALSLYKKVLSTNQSLKNELFYSEDNITIIDDGEIQIEKILGKPFDHTLDKYILSIEQWLYKIGL